VREDAPQGLRIGYLQIAHDEIQLTYNEMRLSATSCARSQTRTTFSILRTLIYRELRSMDC
jgi:hypothetical protein